MKYYAKETEEVLREVGSSVDGLSSAEAEKRLAENGKNKLSAIGTIANPVEFVYDANPELLGSMAVNASC